MPTSSADHDLLLGVLALHLDFLSREQLLNALKEWAADKGQPLAQVILRQNVLTDDELAALEALAQKHLGRHGQDVKKSLTSLPAFLSIREVLGEIAGEGFLDTVSHSLDASAGGDDPLRTWPSLAGAPDGVGKPTSAGRRFRVLRAHAKGGLGQVSVALDGELNREVALKEIQAKYADHPESRARFLLEAEVTGGLEHPGVVPVYSLGKHPDGRPFYAMRFIRGDSLKDAIDRFHKAGVPGRDPGERGLALRQLLGRFVDVCEAMAYAHSRGVLHRDLKPGNVMLGKYGETLVVDWGLAKPLGERHSSEDFVEQTLRPSGSGATPTQMGKAVGTPAYMSPEQAAGRLDLLGPASDIYSLGATLYTLLTGKPPIEGLTLEAILRKVQEGDFPAPRKVKPQVAPALEAVCRMAMALKPEDRYGSAKELAEDVEHWLAGEPVKAWPEPLAVRMGRFLKRHRTLVTSGVATMGVAALVLAGATVLLSTAYENERLAKEAAETAKEKETAAKEAALAAESDAKTQRDEALKQRKRADANFAKAKKAVEDYLTKVTDHPRLNEHDFRDLRKE
jgi:serine/threonine-protein kinase